MEKYNYTIIEKWWRGLGIYSREQASGLFCVGNVYQYLNDTDDWWDSLTDEQKLDVYNDFFEEE